MIPRPCLVFAETAIICRLFDDSSIFAVAFSCNRNLLVVLQAIPLPSPRFRDGREGIPEIWSSEIRD